MPFEPRTRARLIAKAFSPNPTTDDGGVTSYSASAEDLVARTILLDQGIDLGSIFYVDIGAAEPTFLSNTALFYRGGASGLLVEPDPAHVTRLRAARPRDTVLPIGISPDKDGEMEYFRFTNGVFNTFSAEQAQRVITQSRDWLPHQRQRLIETVKVRVRPVNDVLAEYCTNRTIHFMSIDIEGSNFEVLHAIDFVRFRPMIICVERSTDTDKATHEGLLGPFGYRLCYQNNDNFVFLVPRKGTAQYY